MIGGEFSIPAAVFQQVGAGYPASPDVYSYASGRAALYQILKYLKREAGISRILLPDYLCTSVLVPVQALHLEFAFYPLDNALRLLPDFFKRSYSAGDAVLLVNYFGLQDLAEDMAYIRSIDNDAILIEDDVQAYYEFKKELDYQDFRFTSLRKSFAIPDGGLVKTRHPLPRVEASNSFGQYKAAAAVIKSMREGHFFDDRLYLELFEKGESLINDDLERGMSRLSGNLLGIQDEEVAKTRRIDNACYLVGELEKLGIKPVLPLVSGKVPLFVPVFLENRDQIRRELFKKEIYCPVHWPSEGMDVAQGARMEEHELSLIVDQRYGRQDMAEIANVIRNTY